MTIPFQFLWKDVVLVYAYFHKMWIFVKLEDSNSSQYLLYELYSSHIPHLLYVFFSFFFSGIFFSIGLLSSSSLALLDVWKASGMGSSTMYNVGLYNYVCLMSANRLPNFSRAGGFLFDLKS